MKLSAYLPSSRFASIALSIGLAVLLVIAAEYVTRPYTPPQSALSATQGDDIANIDNGDWRTELDAIAAGTAPLPTPPSEDNVNELLTAAKNGNVTDTVARSLFVNLSAASAQGLGSDIPTQDKIIESARAAANAPAKKTFTSKDISSVSDSAKAQKDYGNAVMVVLGHHTGATSQAVLLAVSKATDNNDRSQLDTLKGIQADYQSLVRELAALDVPKTLVPLHVQALNDLDAAAASLGDLQKLFDDPLLGLQSLQRYQAMLGEVGRVCTSIAQSFSKNGILFSKDEPGVAWSAFISSDL